jgi:hypothetical protein
VTSTREEKSIRGSWPDGSKVAATLYPKGGGRCQITVEQRKLPDAVAAAEGKKFCAEGLDALKRSVEGT